MCASTDFFRCEWTAYPLYTASTESPPSAPMVGFFVLAQSFAILFSSDYYFFKQVA